MALIDLEIQQMLEKEAIHVVPPGEIHQGLVSSIFLVPKKGSGQRPVVNLGTLNQFIPYEHFKMEGIRMLKDLLRKGHFMVKIDLKDAYFTVPVWKNHQTFLRFVWKETMYEFACLPFSLSSAPRVFTKLMKHNSRTPSGQNQESKKGMSVLTGLATSNSETTSQVTGPSYFYHSSCLFKAPPLPPLAKREKRALAHSQTYDSSTPLSPQAKEELVWWRDNLEAWNGKALILGSPDLVIERGVSRQGRGAFCNGVSTGGQWSQGETLLHITCLELLAGAFAVKAFVKGKVQMPPIT